MRRLDLPSVGAVAVLVAATAGLGLVLTWRVHVMPLADDRLAHVDLLWGLVFLLLAPVYLGVGQFFARPRRRPVLSHRPAIPSLPVRHAEVAFRPGWAMVPSCVAAGGYAPGPVRPSVWAAGGRTPHSRPGGPQTPISPPGRAGVPGPATHASYAVAGLGVQRRV